MSKVIKHILASFFLVFLISKTIYAQNIPKITIRTVPLFDSVCSKKTNYTIKPNWRKELDRQLPEIRNTWGDQGKKLLSTTIEIVGGKFNLENYIANLSLCSFPSMSEPLLINSRYVLNGFTDNPISQDVLIGTIYHELLHIYLEGRISENSKMLMKYHNESSEVKGHIHLLALMKAVYLKLGWQEQLADIRKKDDSLPNKDYKRAWEIVDTNDNTALLIQEIKN